MKVIITVGLPGSGKSTWAREYQSNNHNVVLVNRDELRSMLHQGVWSKSNEKMVVAVRDHIILESLERGHDVIVHDTNFGKNVEHIRDLVEDLGAKVEIQDFTHVPLDECIRRDQKRSNYVGEKVIRRMYNDFLAPTIPPVERNPDLPDAILCDIDGTLALANGRNHYDRDYINDPPHIAVVDLVKDLVARERIIFVSGRKDTYYGDTAKWLNGHFGTNWEALYMRRLPEEEGISDTIVKERIYNEYIKDNYNVKFVLDDRDRVVDYWRQIGLTCFQVAPGNF